MVDWAYVCGMADDTGNDPDEETHDPEGRCGSMAGFYQRLVPCEQPAVSRSRSKAYGPALKCRHCGDPDVYWQFVLDKNGYRLFDTATQATHICKPNLEGFDQ